MTTDRPAVHQILATLSYGDAIGNEAQLIRQHLRAAGFASDIFAEAVHPRLVSEARPLPQYLEVATAETVCLFHFALGSAAGPLAFHAPGRLVVIYHNVTPAHFFLGFQNHVVGLSHHGRRSLRAFAPRAELALGVSEFNRQELETAGFRRTGVLPFVLDLNRFPGRPAPVVQRLYRDGRINLLFVGRIIPNKRIEDLVRVFAVFERHFERRSRLLLVGDAAGCPHYLRRLREQIEDLGLRDVVFAGHVEDDELLAYYSLADVFVCLSEHEGYCVPLVEAMACGVPVVAFDAGAVAETLGGGGVLVREKRPEAVAALLDRIITDRSLRSAILARQAAVVRRLKRIDFGALLLERLAPVLQEVA